MDEELVKKKIGKKEVDDERYRECNSHYVEDKKESQEVDVKCIVLDSV